jgi:hypothetical protein
MSCVHEPLPILFEVTLYHFLFDRINVLPHFIDLLSGDGKTKFAFGLGQCKAEATRSVAFDNGSTCKEDLEFAHSVSSWLHTDSRPSDESASSKSSFLVEPLSILTLPTYSASCR